MPREKEIQPVKLKCRHRCWTPGTPHVL